MDVDPVIEQSELGAPLREVARSGFAVAGLRIAAYAIGFVASILISRALGPTGRGLYALPLAILGVVMALSHIGLEHANVWLAAQRVSLKELWATATATSILLALLGWTVFAVVALSGADVFFHVPWLWLAVALAQTPLLLQSTYWTNVIQLDGGLVSAVRATTIGVAVHASACGALYVLGELTPFRVLVLTWVATGATWSALLFIGARRGLTGARPGWALMRRAFGFGVKSAVGLLFFFLVLRVDQLLVRHVLGIRALGFYSLAVALAEFLWLISDPFASSLLPYQVRSENDDDRRLGFAALRMTLIFASVAGLIAWMAAPAAVRLAYGEAFLPSVSPFRVLIPGIVLLAAQRSLGAILLKEGRPWTITVIGLAVLAGNVVLNLVLLPSMGIVGASIASTICYALLFACYVLITAKRGVVGARDLLPRAHDARMLVQGLVRRGP